MANVLNILSNTLKVSKYTFKTIQCSSLLTLQARNLYSAASLGLDSFIQQRTVTEQQLSNIKDKFKSKMETYSSEDSSSMIFTEDLKNMIHLADAEDVNLVMKMMNRFNLQNKELRFGNFVFGPVVMRMFHVLNKPDEALACFNSEELNGFFHQIISYQILMDILYENGKYQEILDVFKKVTDIQLGGNKYTRHAVVFLFAACYKLNTPESFKQAITVWKDLQEVGHDPMRRAITFFAALALNQGKPDLAIEVLSCSKNQTYTTVRNLKVLALCKVGRLEDVMPIFKNILQEDTQTKHTFNKNVLSEIKAAVEENGSTEMKVEFNRISKQLEDMGSVSNETLEQQLCSEINTRPRTQTNIYPRNDFRRNYRNSQTNYQSRINRPGLADMQ